MRKFTATFLLICLGIMLPVAAMPVRICLLEPEERTDNCCNTCTSDTGDCCADVDPLPELLLQDGNFEMPEFTGYALPPTMMDLPIIPKQILPPSCLARAPTGIGSTTARLAALNIWRL